MTTAPKTRLKYSKKQAFIMASVLAVFGVATLLYTKASTENVETVVQAENFRWTRSTLVNAKDAGNKAIELNENSKGIAQFSLKNDASKLSVTGKATTCAGNPAITISVNDKAVSRVTLGNTDWDTATLDIDPKLAPAGKHTVTVAYDSDHYLSEECDRNIIIDKITFTSIIQNQTPPPPPPITIGTPPAPPPAPAPEEYDPNAPFNIIMIGWRAEQEASYKQLRNSQTNLIYRTCCDYGKNSPAILRWEKAKQKYMYTIAASDKHPSGSIYVNPTDAEEVIRRSNNVGFYMHEVVSYYAATQTNWDWNAAASRVDWGFIDRLVKEAKSQNKKVIWSEPAHGWNTINSGSYQHYISSWGNTLVPMFATNFADNNQNLMGPSMDGARRVAATNGMKLGESTQSWHFREQTNAFPHGPSVRESYDLNMAGYNIGASYWQIEGTYEDMAWGTNYMNGIHQFANFLNSAQPRGVTYFGPVYRVSSSGIREDVAVIMDIDKHYYQKVSA